MKEIRTLYKDRIEHYIRLYNKEVCVNPTFFVQAFSFNEMQKIVSVDDLERIATLFVDNSNISDYLQEINHVFCDRKYVIQYVMSEFFSECCTVFFI